jgi:hypothetical protein
MSQTSQLCGTLNCSFHPLYIEIFFWVLSGFKHLYFTFFPQSMRPRFTSTQTTLFMLFMSMGQDHVSEMWRAKVEWYWQGKAKELGEKPVPVSFFPPQISHGLIQAWTQACMVRG